MTQSAIQLVCLDLGGVMIRICGGWEEACSLAAVSLPSGGGSRQEITRGLAPIVRSHESGRTDEQTFLQQASRVVGLLPDQVTAVSAAWLKGPYPGARPRRPAHARPRPAHRLPLEHQRPPLAHHDHARAHYLGLDKLTWRFASFEIGSMKPDPGIYEYVERVAAKEGIARSSIAFFDDNEANIAAAAAHDWHAVRIDPQGDPPRQDYRSAAARARQCLRMCSMVVDQP